MIEINELTKEYISGKEKVFAVNNISATINMNEFITVIGQSGSGKSTLLTLLGGLSKPTSGSIVVDDIDIYNLSSKQLAKFRHEYIGFVFQSFQLVNYLTVEENVLLPLAITNIKNKEQKELAEKSLTSVGLANKRKRLMSELSGGEQQRVAIARALINDPLIILADEPTGNLDTETSKAIMKIFLELKSSGKSIIMVTHNKEFTQYSDRSIELSDGEIVNRTYLDLSGTYESEAV
ncbi:MAG: ABC transporter ATP-binding protein [Melioribacteraceae bacterium]|nr:ABC transporter ATP-binding protein [Melioribacteraceae bacterium]MCF8353195.1 ABC transporter ATP-binding protein [Melioribacteraceae bacterium]MCF8395338.1 ABC transporter ATP-binding protein [Melioribacteraceae bacterium]MCF8418771.1 ABC transporter ATP-binding protein [Melioribacteraceae bacterium]